MSRRSAGAAVLAPLAWLLASGPVSPQGPIPLGGEFQINFVTAGSQLTTSRRSIAVEDNGDFVVVWTSDGQDGSAGGVFGQRFGSSGARLGIEFQVNTYTPGIQYFGAVASDADGDFVVVWDSKYQDGDTWGVFARRFNSAGTPIATEFQVNVATVGNQLHPAVATDADGDFVVAWDATSQGSYVIVFRRFSSAGAAIGGELIANTATSDYQSHPAIDYDGSGRFVIVWDSVSGDGSSPGVLGQLFNASGGRMGGEFHVNAYVTGQQIRPTVGRAADGDFVVSWMSNGQDGSVYGVFGRRFDSTGTPQASEFMVSTYTYGGQYQPALEVRANGAFLVAWESNSQETGEGSGVFARGFDAAGSPTSGEIHVNTTTPGHQVLAAVGANPGGDFVVAWSSNGQDGSGYGVVGQRFHLPSVLDVDGNGQLTALTDGLLLLRFFFGFSGSTLTSGAVGPNCSRCDSATILAYLQSLA